MSGWLIAGVYVAGLVYVSRRATVAFLEHEADPRDAFDRVFARFIGLMAGLLWPLIVAGALITGKLPKTNKELEAEVRERDRRIKQLERELGIGRG